MDAQLKEDLRQQLIQQGVCERHFKAIFVLMDDVYDAGQRAGYDEGYDDAVTVEGMA